MVISWLENLILSMKYLKMALSLLNRKWHAIVDKWNHYFLRLLRWKQAIRNEYCTFVPPFEIVCRPVKPIDYKILNICVQNCIHSYYKHAKTLVVDPSDVILTCLDICLRRLRGYGMDIIDIFRFPNFLFEAYELAKKEIDKYLRIIVPPHK